MDNPPEFGIYRLDGNELTILACDPHDFRVSRGTENVQAQRHDESGGTSPGGIAVWDYKITIPSYPETFQLEEGRQQILVKLRRVIRHTYIGSSPIERIPDGEIPDFVSNVLRWHPIDTETLVVATDFSLTNDPRPPSDVVHIARMLAVDPLPASLKEFVTNRRVTWAVHGGRNFDVVSKFGGVRQEGASVIRLENELSDEQQEDLRRTLREKADTIRSVSQNEVYVFPANRDGMEPTFQLKPWQGEFVVLIDNRTLITASGDAYLEQILERMKTAPEDRALPAHLPEWKHLDSSAEAWLLRHLPARNEQIEGMRPGRDRQFRGLVWMANTSVDQPFRAVYLPMPDHHVDKVGDKMWAASGGAATPEAHVFSRSVKRLPDGAMVFTLEEEPPGMVLFYLHYSQGLWR